MRNIVPPLMHVHTLELASGGSIGMTAETNNRWAPGNPMYNIANSNSTQILPAVDAYGPQSWYIDVYPISTKSVSFQVSPGASRVKASPVSGTLSASGNCLSVD